MLYSQVKHPYVVILFVCTAYLDQGDYNVITVHWGEYSNQTNYFKTVSKCNEVGIVTGYFLLDLFKQGFLDPNNTHIIGHSVGAHVAGSSGRTFFSESQTKLARITGEYNSYKTYRSNSAPIPSCMFPVAGLDPSSPGFKDSWFSWRRSNRLDDSDALFVDVIHTASGISGMSKPIGHADFYPNNGVSPQPACKLTNPFKSSECT